MRVSSQFPIAVHAMLMLTYFSDDRVTSDVIAESTGCNAVTIRNIFSKLKNAQLISSGRGRGGIIVLKTAQEITLWDIFKAVEGGSTEEIFTIQENTSQLCVVGKNIRGIMQECMSDAVCALQSELSKTTLATIIDQLKKNDANLDGKYLKYKSNYK